MRKLLKYRVAVYVFMHGCTNIKYISTAYWASYNFLDFYLDSVSHAFPLLLSSFILVMISA